MLQAWPWLGRCLGASLGSAFVAAGGLRVHRTGFLVAVEGGLSGAAIRGRLFLAAALQAPRKSPETVAGPEACVPQAASCRQTGHQAGMGSASGRIPQV